MSCPHNTISLGHLKNMELNSLSLKKEEDLAHESNGLINISPSTNYFLHKKLIDSMIKIVYNIYFSTNII